MLPDELIPEPEEEAEEVAVEVQGPGIEWEVITPNKKIRIAIDGELEEAAKIALKLWEKSITFKG